MNHPSFKEIDVYVLASGCLRTQGTCCEVVTPRGTQESLAVVHFSMKVCENVQFQFLGGHQQDFKDAKNRILLKMANTIYIYIYIYILQTLKECAYNTIFTKNISTATVPTS